MFGLPVRDKLEVGGWTLLRSGGFYRRVRDGETVFEAMVSSRLRLMLYPTFPLFYPKFLTQFILCVLDKPILVAPGEELWAYTLLDVDAAVYAESASVFNLIDVIPLHDRYKLTLYGPRDGGVIARLCRSAPYTSPPALELGKALMPVTIINESRASSRIARVDMILLDASPLKLYYKRGTWYVATQEIEMRLVTEDMAIISYKNPPPGLVEVRDPPGLRPPILGNKSNMQWGYSRRGSSG